MNKIIGIAVIVSLLIVPVCFAGDPIDVKYVGLTKTGVAYLSGEWVEQWGYSVPRFNDGKYGWTGKGEQMKYDPNTGYWTLQLPAQYGQRKLVIFNNELDYSNMWSAHEAVKNDDAVGYEPKEKPSGPGCISVDNSVGGYNFVCIPVAKAPWK